MKDFLKITGALSDENRVRLLMSLAEGELCVCSLVDLIGLADSTVSKHMSILREAGLVETQKRGRWVYYRLAATSDSLLIRDALRLARQHLEMAEVIAADRSRLSKMIMKDASKNCQAARKPFSQESGSQIDEQIYLEA